MRLLEVVIFLFFTQVIFAQGYPITLESPIMQDVKGFEVHTLSHYQKGDGYRYFGQALKLGYSTGYKVQLGVVLPYENLSVTGWRKREVAGLGDFSIFGKFRVHQKDAKYKAVRLLIFAKETFPTGKVSRKFNETTFGLIFGSMQRKTAFHANIAYVIFNENDYLAGGVSLASSLWVSENKTQKVNLYVEVNEEVGTRNGVYAFYFSPGLQFESQRKWLFDVSYHLPLLESDFNTKLAFSVGARYLGAFGK